MKLQKIINKARVINGACLLLFGCVWFLKYYKVGIFAGFGDWILLVFVVLALIQVVVMAINFALIPEKRKEDNHKE